MNARKQKDIYLTFFAFGGSGASLHTRAGVFVRETKGVCVWMVVRLFMKLPNLMAPPRLLLLLPLAVLLLLTLLFFAENFVGAAKRKSFRRRHHDLDPSRAHTNSFLACMCLCVCVCSTVHAYSRLSAYFTPLCLPKRQRETNINKFVKSEKSSSTMGGRGGAENQNNISFYTLAKCCSRVY